VERIKEVYNKVYAQPPRGSMKDFVDDLAQAIQKLMREG
jgi:hypothetical protein